MYDTIFTLSKCILEATPGEKTFNPGQETLFTIWKKIVHNQGGPETPAPQDTIAILWKKYLINLGGTPHPYDNAFNFLWKAAKEQGVTLAGIETLFTLLKKICKIAEEGGNGNGEEPESDPSTELLTLAEDDGWGFLYDPTNPSYRTLGTDATNGDVEVVRQVRDGLELRESLGKIADGSPEEASLSPYYHKAAIGSWDGMEFHDRDTSDRKLRLPALAAPVSQPYFVVALVKSPSGGSISKTIFDKDNSLIVRKSGASDQYVASVDLPTSGSTLDFNIGRGRDAQTVLIEVLVNGATSKTWVNGVEDASGDIFGTSALNGFTLGASEDSTSFHWDGRIGPVGIFEGEPSDAVRKRMENLLLKYSDAEIFEIPEALDLDGLALWLDGSDGSTLRDFSGAVAADGSIYRWVDKSGLLNHATQGTSAARPIRKVGEQNGLDVALFDGSDDYLNLADKSILRNLAGSTVFLVAANAATTYPDTVRTAWMVEDTSGNVMFSLSSIDSAIRTAARRLSFDIGSEPWSIVTSAPEWPGSFELVSVRADYANGVLEGWRNGASMGTDNFDSSGNSNDADSPAVTLGTQDADDFNRWWQGGIAAILIYQRALSQAEREQIEEYLQNKWATPALL